jgi:tetratricopeptide (TPR) repeat protein
MRHPTRLLATTAIGIALTTLTPSCSPQAKADRHFSQALKHLENENNAAAEIEFKNLLSRQPNHPEALKMLGIMWVRQGLLFNGAQLLGDAQQVSPSDDEIAYNLALALFGMGYVGDCRAELLKILDRSPSHGTAVMLLAETTITPEAFTETEQRLNQVEDPGAPPVLFSHALLALRRGEIESGHRMLDEAIAKDPGFARAHALLGTIHRSSGMHQAALSPIQKAAELAGPRSPETGLLAALLVEMERPEEAREILQQALEQAPDYLPNWRALATVDLVQNDTEAAQKHLTKVLSINPFDPESAVLISQLHLQQNEPAKAIAVLEKVASAIPSRPTVEIELAKAYLAAEEPRKAADKLDLVLGLVPSAFEAAIMRARLHLKEGQSEQAIRTITALETGADHRRVQDILIEAYLASNRPDRALTIVRQQAAASPAEAGLQLLLGQLLATNGNTEEARQALGYSLQLEPTSIAAIAQLSAMDIQQNDHQAAADRLDSFLLENPSSADAHRLKAALEMSRNQHPIASTHLQKAIELDPAHPASYGMLVQIKSLEERYDEAIEITRKVLETDPANREARLQLGVLLEQLDRPEEARAEYQRITTEHPHFAAGFNNLAVLDTTPGGDLQTAYGNARTARELDSRNPAIADTLGWVEYLLGNYREALPLLQEAAGGLPTYPTAHYHLAMAHYMMAQPEQAESAFMEALAITRPFPEKADAEARISRIRNLRLATIDDLRATLTEDPFDINYQLALAAQLQQAGHSEASLAVYEKALAINPAIEQPHLGISAIHVTHTGDHAKALDAALRARAIAPQNPHTTAALGSANLANNNYSEAFALLQEARYSLPEDPQMMFNHARAAYAIGRIAEARSLMTELASGTSALAGKARDFTALTAPGAAEDPAMHALSEEILTDDPDHVPALMLRASLQGKSSARVAEIYQRILSIHPQFDIARKHLAIAYIHDPDKRDEAKQLALIARRSLRDDSELTAVLAVASHHEGEHRYAAQLFSELSASRPLQADELLALGISQAQINHTADARATLQQALQAGLKDHDAAKAKTLLDELEE